MRSLKFAAGFCAALCLATTGTVQAAISFLATGAGGREASAAFNVDNSSNLIIELSNTSTSDARFQIDFLSAVFFQLTTPNPLTLQSAVASGPLGIYQQNSTVNTNANGSLVLLSVPNFAAPGSTNGGPGAFNGGWQFRENLLGLAGVSQTRGLGTNGLGIFNGSQVKNVDNLDYALTSFGDNVATSQAKQLFNFPAIKDTLTFTLSGLPNGFVLNSTSISNVRFQYGTSLAEPSTAVEVGVLSQVPEPISLMTWSLMISAAVVFRGRVLGWLRCLA